MRNAVFCAAVCLSVAAFTGCRTRNIDCQFNGLSTPDGPAVAHVNTSSVGIHLFGNKPLIGEASLKKTFDDFTAEARRLNCGKVRVVQSSYSHGWFFLPPFTFILTPTFAEVAGDVYK